MFGNHTYTLERNGKVCREHEYRLKPFQQAHQAWGKAAGEGENSRQPTRTGYKVQKNSGPSAIEKFLEGGNDHSSLRNSVAEEQNKRASARPKETGVVPATKKNHQ